MAIVPAWWSEYLALQGGGSTTIRDTSGQLVVFDPDDTSGLNPIQNQYVQNDFSLSADFLASSSALATGNTVAGFPSDPVNTIAGYISGSTVIPGDDVGAILSRVIQAANAIWGSDQIGQIRTSSGYLYSDPTSGVRFGSIVAPRVIMPFQNNRR